MEFQWTTNLSSKIYSDALSIREEVFIKEQNVPKALEVDSLESHCLHVVGYNGAEAVCCARLLPKSSETVKLQRVAVRQSFRGQHIGKFLLMECINKSLALSYQTLILGAQNHAIPFYKKLGFTICSNEYQEAGIAHHDMQLSLASYPTKR